MDDGCPSTAGHPLREVQRPEFELGSDGVRLVDLFAGCGGLTLGVAQATHGSGYALDIALAVDADPDAIAAYRANFPKATTVTGQVEDCFPGPLGSGQPGSLPASIDAVPIDVLVGGPPCQGHSDLNNHTRRTDPKNALYLLMARAAEVLNPSIVLVENVPAVLHDSRKVVAEAKQHLQQRGYNVADAVINLQRLGVPQKRRRHVLLATESRLPSAEGVLEVLENQDDHTDLRWAIGDLQAVKSDALIDTPSRPSAQNVERMGWLISNDEYDLPNRLRPKCHQDDHSYKSMYGRLRWTEPAQTITSGFGSIGQGRYMHPELPRALTPHEAARIQGFPDYFDFTTFVRRSSLATTIGNAAPPALSRSVLAQLLPHLR